MSVYITLIRLAIRLAPFGWTNSSTSVATLVSNDAVHSTYNQIFTQPGRADRSVPASHIFLNSHSLCFLCCSHLGKLSHSSDDTHKILLAEIDGN
jgi:hypothetical protein